jgi:hypothetical protein
MWHHITEDGGNVYEMCANVRKLNYSFVMNMCIKAIPVTGLAGL